MILGLLQLAVVLALVLGSAWPLGVWLARALGDGVDPFGALPGRLERALLAAIGVRDPQEQDWRAYTASMLWCNALGIALLFALQVAQHLLPWNPAGCDGVRVDTAFNTAVSFVTNTNWQAYGGESTMSLFVQAAGLTVQNFLSAATGMAILAALTRGLARSERGTVGNFWQDLVRTTLYVLVPLAVVTALVLVAAGVPQTLAAGVRIAPLEAGSPDTIALGPVASQVAIKQLGTNGGGFFNANSAHPFENPTPWSNLLEVVAILLLPAAACPMFGRLVGDVRQGRILLAAMLVLFVPLAIATVVAELHGNPALAGLGVDLSAGNLEGKELRVGAAGSAIWAAATTAASNGSVDAMHDSFTALGGLWPLWLMQLGEVVFGGVGSGLYGLLLFVLVAVFVAGLMVGRTPEYLGKKLAAFEMKMASLAILLPCLAALLGTAVAVVVPAGRDAVGNPGAHGFGEILYAFSSTANNNGSAFGGLSANSPFWNLATAAAMLLGRFGVAVPVLAIAGALVRKRRLPVSAGTLPTHGPLFLVVLVAVVLLVGALTFLPALALGPVAEHLRGGH